MIPCSVWIFKRLDWHPICYTHTYWGAKRFEKKMQKRFPETDFLVTEVWNMPYTKIEDEEVAPSSKE